MYTLKKILLQPDREYFIKAMEEVRSMFEQGILKAVPKQAMLDHYDKQLANGTEIKRQQIMMIWSFKRKLHPDGTLNKHKAGLRCVGGHNNGG